MGKQILRPSSCGYPHAAGPEAAQYEITIVVGVLVDAADIFYCITCFKGQLFIQYFLGYITNSLRNLLNRSGGVSQDQFAPKTRSKEHGRPRTYGYRIGIGIEVEV